MKQDAERLVSRPDSGRITAHEARVIAAAAAVDPRTVARYLAGRKVASTCGTRIAAALREAGFPDSRFPPPSTEKARG